MEPSPDDQDGAMPSSPTPPGRPSPSPPPAEAPPTSRRYRLAWLVAALVVLIAYVWLRYAVGGPRVTRIVEDGLVAAAAVAAALALTHLARTVEPSMRRGWWALALGAWFEAAGEILWTGYVVIAGGVPYPGPPDVFYLAGYPLLVAGFVLLAYDPRDTRPRLRLTLDGLIVATALLTVGWHYILQPLLLTSSLGSLETLVSLAYPALDILVASIALVVAANARGPRRLPLLIIAAGVFAWALADVSFAAIEFSGGYTYDQIGLLWLVGDFLIALGALHPAARAPAVPGRRRRFEFSELVFPFAPFLVAMALVASLGYGNALDRGDVVLASLVVLLLVARQAHVSRETTRLGRELEANERMLATRNDELLLVNSIVRHDIRNDMNVAHGWAGELVDHVDDEGEEMLDRVLRTTFHTIELTQTLKDFVDALEPGDEPPLEPTPLRPHLEGSIERFRETYPEVDVDVGDVPDVTVAGNPLLDTIFRNLLNNAVQHNDSAEVRVEVAVETSDDAVQIRVADNGPGIPEAQRITMFGRDEKGLESTSSGVGLYLVETLVDQYGGELWIEDNEPRGAVIVVDLLRPGERLADSNVTG